MARNTIHVDVQNPDGVCRGLKSLTVDGHLIEGDLVPADKVKARSKIVAILG